MSLTLSLTLTRDTQSVENNTTSVSWTLKYTKSSSSYNTKAVSYYVNIDGTRVQTSTYTFKKNNTSGTISSGTTTIKHNSDGTHANITGYAYVGPTGFSPSSASVTSSSLSLPTIVQTYTITFNANGGMGAPGNQTKSPNATLTLSSTKPTKTGYKFSSWNTASDGSGTSYSAGGSFTTNATTTLYAQYDENCLTVNYYSNYATEAFNGALNLVGPNKSVLVTTSVFKYAASYPKGLRNYSGADSLTPLSRYGYSSEGKYGTSPSGGLIVGEDDGFDSGQVLAEALGVSIINEDASVNIYPQWIPWRHTVQFNTNGGTGSTPGNFSKTTGVDISLPANTPTKNGSTFTYWSTTPSGYDGERFYPSGKYDKAQDGGTVVLYAQWEENKISIYLDRNIKAREFIENDGNVQFKGACVCHHEFIEDDTLMLSEKSLRCKELIEI